MREIERIARNLEKEVDRLIDRNVMLWEENKRLREGVQKVVSYIQHDIESGQLNQQGYLVAKSAQDHLLELVSPAPVTEGPKDDDRPKKKLYFIEAFDSDGAHVDTAYHVDWNRREAYFSVMNRLKPHSRWDATECDINGNIIPFSPKNEDQE